MSSKVFNAMEVGNWSTAKKLIATTSWTIEDLKKKHRVRIELLWLMFKY